MLARHPFLDDNPKLTVLPHGAYILVKGLLDIDKSCKALWCCLEVVANLMPECSIVRGEPVQLVRQCSVQDKRARSVYALVPLYQRLLKSGATLRERLSLDLSVPLLQHHALLRDRANTSNACLVPWQHPPVPVPCNGSR
jgi:hypothetical protein